jgi:hypothetical protein
MRDPTARSEYRFAYCTDCACSTHHWRVRDGKFRCVECSVERALEETDHDRDGLLEPPPGSPPSS